MPNVMKLWLGHGSAKWKLRDPDRRSMTVTCHSSVGTEALKYQSSQIKLERQIHMSLRAHCYSYEAP